MKIIDKTLTKEKVIEISKLKNEPEWMTKFRVKAFEKFEKFDEPKFGPLLYVPFDDITYYKKINEGVESDWNNVDKNVKETFDKIGLIDAETKYLDGVGAQFESEVVYHHMIEELEKHVIFCDTDTALKKYPDLLKKYFNTLVKYDENKYTALNGAVWSGGLLFMFHHIQLWIDHYKVTLELILKIWGSLKGH